MRRRRTTIFGIAALLGVIALIVAGCGGSDPTPAPAARELTVGILHVGSKTDGGYNQAHAEAIEFLKVRVPGVTVLQAENVPETADAERVMENMIQQGAKLIIPASFGYLDPALNVALNNPDVVFEHPGGFKQSDNLGTYWVNTHEGMYLLGIAAGEMTQSNQIGFIAGFPIPNILASVNAFHLGARSVNPGVTTRVVFNNAWVDPSKEQSATNALADQGVDVVTMIVDSPITVVSTAESREIFSIGFHSRALPQFAPEYWLGGIGFTWGETFVKFANDVLDGTWTSESIVGDLGSGMFGFADWGPKVPQSVKDDVAAKRLEIEGGRLSVFQGPISDQSGTVRIPAGQAGGDELLGTTDWLAEGVIGRTS